MQKEAKARIKINGLLKEAGWQFFDDEKGKANIVLESDTRISQKDIDELGNNFEKTKKGYIDFLLLDEKGFPLVVLEAKSEDKNPLDGKEQARRYAKSQNTRFIILSNGNLHYFWDLEQGNPTVITSFPTSKSIKHFKSFQPKPKKLTGEKVDKDYLALTQDPNYEQNPSWQNTEEQQDFIDRKNLVFLRPYQLEAINTVQKAVRKGEDRFLLEMATGTGKTMISAAIIKLFLKTGNANRVLFLVDRIELEEQAAESFDKYLSNDFTTEIYKKNKNGWRRAEVVVSTVQSLSFDNKYQDLFSPTDFDFIISDEAHRSISGNSRAVFEYFVGYKLGLTATPKDYLKNIDPKKINERDVRAWERRQLLDTYRTFGCESGDPTYRYSLIDGVKDGYLINPVVADARTEITTQLLSEKGYSLIKEDEEGVEEEQTFFHKDFEKKFFSNKTNRSFCKVFLENAIKDPLSGEIGKSIVFCVSQKHARKITQILNEFADQLWPGKYNSDFAVQVTSSIPNAQQYTSNFTNNNLNGTSNFLEGYKTSKTRISVTVGMMTTGYDCKDILNLCLMRPIFSPTDFVQIKGRGTRKYTFNYSKKEQGEIEEINKEKTRFKLFDFFANCEYFEDKFDYDEVLKLPAKIKGISEDDSGVVKVDSKQINITMPDPLKTLAQKAIGIEGMKVDRKLFEKFEEVVKGDKVVKEHYQKGDMQALEEHIKDEIFDKPEEYFNLDKLRKAVKADRRISIREFVEKIFGGIKDFKSKDELLEEEFEKFVSINKPENKKILPIKNFFKAYVSDGEVREIIESRKYPQLATNPKVSIQDLKVIGPWKDKVSEYAKDYVALNKYM